jgi:hypothetical protein
MSGKARILRHARAGVAGSDMGREAVLPTFKTAYLSFQKQIYYQIISIWSGKEADAGSTSFIS